MLIWREAHQKSLICGMCSDPPRYYNQLIAKPGAPLPPSEDGDPAFLLAKTPRSIALVAPHSYSASPADDIKSG